MWASIQSVVAWLENHSGTTSLIALIFAVVSALFKPTTWRRVVASILAGLVGFLFLSYDATHLLIWVIKSATLALVFIFAFWWIVGRARSWLTSKNPLPAQPSGTFETIVDTVTRIKGDSNISVRFSSDQGTLTVTRTSNIKK